MEGDATDSDGLEEFGRVLVLLVLIVIEERTDGLWLLWKEDGVALDLSGGVWEDVGHGEWSFQMALKMSSGLLSLFLYLQKPVHRRALCSVSKVEAMEAAHDDISKLEMYYSGFCTTRLWPRQSSRTAAWATVFSKVYGWRVAVYTVMPWWRGLRGGGGCMR